MRQARRNNHGSTIIIVIVAVSFIAILATLVLSISANNVQMKSVERKSKVNFYSAEAALEELKAKLQIELGETIENVYKNVMVSYTDINAGEKEIYFKEQLMKEYLKSHASFGALPDSISLEEGSSSYDWKLLHNMLDKTKDNTEMDNTGSNKLEWVYDRKSQNPPAVYFRNVTLKYVDEKKYMTKLVTDIKVTIPEVSLDAIGTAPVVSDYSLIANKSLSVKNAAASIVGNVYAGDGGILADGSTAALSIKADRVITRDKIAVMNGGTIHMEKKQGADADKLDLWAENIETLTAAEDSGFEPKISLHGNIHVVDDTTLNGSNSKVTFTGSYYGYGYGQVPDKSSALLINRSGCSLDLSGLTNIFVAGRAFIEPASSASDIFTSNENYVSSYVKTGEAISTKGNQAVYRLPEGCIGVAMKNGAKTSIGSNPLPIEEYQRMIDSGDVILVDVDYVLPFSGKRLGYYVNEEKPYNTIFDQTNTTSYVYFYPSFKDEEKANEYFMDYYYCSDGAYMSRLKERMKEYGSTIIAPSSLENSTGRTSIAGNVVSYNALTDQFKLYENSVTASLSDQYVTEADELGDMYKAYCTSLTPYKSSVKSEEKQEDLFDTLMIYESQDQDNPGTMEQLQGQTTKVIENTTYGSYLLCDNKKEKAEGVVFNQDGAFTLDESVPENVHLIVATGDVYVKRNFTGLIISKGVVQIADGITIDAASTEINNLIANTDAKLLFKEYSGFGKNLMTEEKKPLSIEELITTENWRKE